jgi:hypothetical protein
MSERDLSYAAWLARRGRSKARLARLDSGLPPYRRQCLRGAVEARVLQRAATSESLIGPIGSDDEVERERAELVEFARRLRAAARPSQAFPRAGTTVSESPH